MAEHTVFVESVRNGSRRVRSQRKSVDWGTLGPALGGAYECYAHVSSSVCDEMKIVVIKSIVDVDNLKPESYRYHTSADRLRMRATEREAISKKYS